MSGTWNRFIAPSEFLRHRLILGGFPAEKITTLHHGIDPDVFTPRYDHDGYMLYVGRLVEEKGVEHPCRLRTCSRHPFRIVGTGPDEARLHALGHGCRNVEFLGSKTATICTNCIAGHGRAHALALARGVSLERA